MGYSSKTLTIKINYKITSLIPTLQSLTNPCWLIVSISLTSSLSVPFIYRSTDCFRSCLTSAFNNTKAKFQKKKKQNQKTDYRVKAMSIILPKIYWVYLMAAALF